MYPQYQSDSGILSGFFLLIIGVIFLIAQIVLFFRILRMSDDLRLLRRHFVPDDELQPTVDSTARQEAVEASAANQEIKEYTSKAFKNAAAMIALAVAVLIVVVLLLSMFSN